MALLVEGISVIVRIDRIDETYPGGREGFEDDCPNQTLAADGDHASVWFMNPADVESFCKHLEDCGLVFQREGKAIDFAVVDQLQGLRVDCDWLIFVPNKSVDEDLIFLRKEGSQEVYRHTKTGEVVYMGRTTED